MNIPFRQCMDDLQEKKKEIALHNRKIHVKKRSGYAVPIIERLDVYNITPELKLFFKNKQSQ